jgi:hypothetical protein
VAARRGDVHDTVALERGGDGVVHPPKLPLARRLARRAPEVPGATSVVATRTPVASQTHGEA